jgi:alpha-D-ribose 1-methylphosphonate 5-phosphate C-P lyase
MGTDSGKDTPELAYWFAGIDGQTKKEILRAAMKDIADQHFHRGEYSA